MTIVSVVLIADYHHAALRRQLAAVPNTRIVGEVTEPDMLRLVRFLSPDVAVVDCAAPGMNALVTIPWLAGLPNAPQIIALGSIGSAVERRLLLELGAIAYVAPAAPDALTDAVALGQRLTELTHGRLQPALAQAAHAA